MTNDMPIAGKPGMRPFRQVVVNDAQRRLGRTNLPEDP
jgi:hypothetical protein